MSTRSTTHFTYGERPAAIVYRHSDGYPEVAGRDLLAFFEKVRNDTEDTRFNDPSYLAAKYVVFLASMFARRFERDPKTGKYGYTDAAPWSLDFLSVGVVLDDPSDIEYRYVVDCTQQVDGRPRVIVDDLSGTPMGELADVLKQEANA